MVKKPLRQDASAPDRMWIEIEFPSVDEALRKEVATRRAEAATNVLRKLGDDISKFWWHESKGRYCLTTDTGGSYRELSDSGEWFNLNVLAE
jgi:hypothetical protein